MAKRYYVCDVIGDGSEFDPYRAKIADMDVAWSGITPTDETGTPTSTWALAIVETVNHARLSGTPGIDQLPDISLDIKTAAISTVAKTQLNNMLSRRSIGGVAVNSADSYKDVINQIGRSIQPSFSADNFDIA